MPESSIISSQVARDKHLNVRPRCPESSLNHSPIKNIFFTFHVITWLNFDLELKLFLKNILQGLSSKVSRRHTYELRSRLGYIGISGGSQGIKMTALGVDQKTLVFPETRLKSHVTVVFLTTFTYLEYRWSLTGKVMTSWMTSISKVILSRDSFGVHWTYARQKECPKTVTSLENLPHQIR